MRSGRALLLVTTFATAACAAPHRTAPAPADSVFPASWQGAWSGTCTLIADGEVTDSFSMQLQVRPAPEGEDWTWTMTYGEGEGRQVRDYRLRRASDGGAHAFVIDERDGIVLDAFFADGALHSRFTVESNAIDSTYLRLGDQLLVMLANYAADPAGETGDGAVANYRLKSVQRGWLRRKH